MSQSTNINLIPQYTYLGNLYFSQNDVGREATINLMDGSTEYTIPTGAAVKLQATKPSGLGFSVSCTYSGNVVTVVSTATMTDEAGRFPCELQVTNNGVVLGSANFMFNVERNPHPNGTTDGTAESILNDITVAYNHAMDQIENAGGLTVAIKNALLNCFQKVAWIDEHGQDYYDALADELFAVTGITLNSSTLLFSSLGSTQQLTASLIPSTSTATVSWASSDSTVATVSSSGLVTSVANGSATITASVGSVSATCSVSVAVATVTSISAVLNGGTFYVGDPVDDIKPYLTVTATYSDSSTQTVPSGSYTLSGSLANDGENTITVTYEGVSTTVSVTAISAELVSISAVYTQSGTVYDTDTLDSLKADLVVTATYDDSSTETVPSADYTLSGTLTTGTSVITVSYAGFTTTFNVTVTHYVAPPLYDWDFTQSLTDSKQSAVATLGTGITQSSSGLTFDSTSAGQFANLADIGAYGETTIEVDFSAITHGGSGNSTYLTFYSTSSDYRRWVSWNNNDSVWRFRNFGGSWAAFTGDSVTDFNQFIGHTMKIQIDPLVTYSVKMYCDNTLVGSATMDTHGVQNSTIIKLSGTNGTIITGCRIYEGLV